MPLQSVHPPDDESPESWLQRLDSRPTLLPQWPRSMQMALVVLIDTSSEDDPESSTAYVIRSREEMYHFSEQQDQRKLFFLLPKAKLLDSDVVPGLSRDDFEQ